PSAARSFAARYRREREHFGDDLPRHILAAHRGEANRLRTWVIPLSAPALSACLETVLENDDRQKSLGAYSTGADVAAHMARWTILPALLAGLAMPADDLADLIAASRDLQTLAPDWPSSASPPQSRALRAPPDGR